MVEDAPQLGERIVDERVSIAERLIRKLRVSDNPERFQALAVHETREALRVEAVAWVPANRRDPVILSGRVEGLDEEDFRSLIPDHGSQVWVSDLSGPQALPGVNRTAIAPVLADSDRPVGWIVAINPLHDAAFPPEVIEILPLVAGLISSQRNNARLYADIKELLFGVIRSLTSAIDAKDPYTCGHYERVARIAVRLGEQLGLTASQRGDLYLMGLLHDVGKIGIDDQVLKKPGKLTKLEYMQIQSHVRIGLHILSDLKKLRHLLPGVAHHHESFDGTGYPAGLAGEHIPLSARILAVADAYDAMSSTRPYRARMTPAQIDQIFREGSGKQWDARVVDALFACQDDLELIRERGLGESLRVAIGGALTAS
jgi:HD-GYP domain-containing protein (c-di-GMP phosphodiesterase class II)